MNDRQALQEIKKLFKDNQFERTALSKRGKLDTNRLSFYKTSQRIFAEKLNTSGKKYSIELLIDCSGSMFEANALAAFAAAKNFISVLQYVCPINVCMFNYLEKNITAKEFMMWDYKTFKRNARRPAYIQEIEGKKYVMEKQSSEGNLGYNDADCGNWELANIHNAADRLMQKPGGKIIMVLQDGQPACNGWDEDWYMFGGKRIRNYPTANYKEMVRKLVKKGIDIVSFGIDTETPKKFYDKFYLLSNPNEAFGKMVEYLKTVVSI